MRILPLGLITSVVGEGVLLVALAGTVAMQAAGASFSSETLVGALLVLLVGGMLMRSVSAERRTLDAISKLREDFSRLDGRLVEIGNRLTSHERQVADVYGAFGAEREVAKQDRHDFRGQLTAFVAEVELRLMEQIKRIDERVQRNEDRLAEHERRIPS